MSKSNGEQLDVLDSAILKARIAQLEYGTVEDGKFNSISVEEIRRVYIEETGVEPPNGITLYKSDDFKSEGRDSGFDGTVIHFYDPEKGINQSYTIPRGSEHAESGGEGDGQPLDWIYNGLGIFTGKVNDQFQDAKDFEKWASEEINKVIETENDISIPELEKYGIGHSLGGNHIQMLHLLGADFDGVYALNDAAPTVYQLAANDPKFFRDIRREFRQPFQEVDELYKLDPNQLRAFTLNYYKSKGIHIEHITSEEDALYPLHLTRGFIRFGNEQVVDTNPALNGLDNVITRIPDKELQSLQKYLATASPYYEEAGMDGLFHFATGIDNDFLKNMNVLLTGDPESEGALSLKNIAKFTFSNPFKAVMNRYEAFKGIVNQIPVIQERLQTLTKQLPTLIVIADAMTGEEGQRISDYLRSIQERVENVSGVLLAISTFDIKTAKGFSDSFKGIMYAIQQLDGILSDFHSLWASGKDLLSDILGSFDAHGLEALINGLSQPNRHYVGNDLIYSAGGGASVIKVNISSATRLYWMGLDNYEEKIQVNQRIQRAYIDKFEQPYDTRRKDLLTKIGYMETNPHSFSYLLGGGDREMVGISVQEHIPPMPSQITNAIDGIQSFYAADIEKGKLLFSQMKEAIIELFSEDQLLTVMFELR